MPYTSELPFVALIRRDLLRSLRGRFLAGAMMLACGIAVVTLMVLWPANDDSLSRFSGVAEAIVILFAVLSAASVCLLLPGLAGGAIIEERSLDTFDLMRMTLVRPIGILAGKFVNSLGAFLLLMMAVLPLFSTTYFLVGVDWDALLVIALAVTVSAITCVSVGLACSASYRNPLSATIASYVWCALALGGYMLLVYFVLVIVYLFSDETYFESVAERTLLATFRTTPVCLLFSAFRIPVAVHMPSALLIQAIVSALALLVAWRKLCKPPRDPALPHSVQSRRGRVRVKVPAGYSSRPRKPIADHRNPIFIREARHTGLLKGVSRWRMIVLYAMLGLIAVVLCAGVYYVSEAPMLPEELNSIVSFIFQWLFCIVVGLAPAILATSFVREDEQDTKDLLNMTALTPRDIVIGKIKAGAYGLAKLCFLLLVAGWPLLTIVAKSANGWLQLLATVMWALPCIIACFALASIASMTAQRTALAVPLAYGLCAAYFFGPSFTVVGLFQILHFSSGVNAAEDFAVLLSPVVSQLDMLDRMGYRRSTLDGTWLLRIGAHLAAALLLARIAVRGRAEHWLKRPMRTHS
ncbi:MAG: hypothetical protein WC655_12780 [Candidatus Hydrogenedentales bacterium]|jgi:hypothetical protein